MNTKIITRLICLIIFTEKSADFFPQSIWIGQRRSLRTHRRCYSPIRLNENFCLQSKR
jgi:hypothetical protein